MMPGATGGPGRSDAVRCTWQEVENYLEGSKGILLPVGSTEQHGPNGLIGTDAICAELVARGVGEATGAMVAPTLNFGMAQHHMAFRGTMTLRPQTLLAVLVDLLNSLAQRLRALPGDQRPWRQHGDHHGGVLGTAAAYRQPECGKSHQPPALPHAQLVGLASRERAARGAVRRPRWQPRHRERDFGHQVRLS